MRQRVLHPSNASPHPFSDLAPRFAPGPSVSQKPQDPCQLKKRCLGSALGMREVVPLRRSNSMPRTLQNPFIWSLSDSGSLQDAPTPFPSCPNKKPAGRSAAGRFFCKSAMAPLRWRCSGSHAAQGFFANLPRMPSKPNEADQGSRLAYARVFAVGRFFYFDTFLFHLASSFSCSCKLNRYAGI